jgi:RNA-directed DNA polymerase
LLGEAGSANASPREAISPQTKPLSRCSSNGPGWIQYEPEIGLFNPDKVRATRYRYRGTAIPTPWPATG